MLRLIGGMTRGVCKHEHVRPQNSFIHRPRNAIFHDFDVPDCAALRTLGIDKLAEYVCSRYITTQSNIGPCARAGWNLMRSAAREAT